MPRLLKVAPLIEITPLSPSRFLVVENKPKIGSKVKTGLWALFGVCSVANKI